MPGMDKTGPVGTGPNGSGRGPCGGGLGYQQGSGLGMGRGFRHGGRYGLRSSQPISQEDEKNILEQRMRWLQTQIETVNKRLEELNNPES